MRYLAFLLFLISTAANGQDIRWADCKHTQLNEKFLSVRVAFMVGDEEWSYRTLTGTNLKSQVVTFKTATTQVALDGMKLDCRWTVEGLPKPTRVTVYTPWPAPINIPVGVSPKLGVAFVETSPGLWRAYIGNAP